MPWSAAAAVVSGTGLIGLHGQLYGRWIVDDAGITFGYARSVARGLGPVLQPGAPPVEGYSNPAWLALLVLGRLLGLFDHGTILGVPDYVVFPKAVALLCCAGMLTAFHAVARPLTRHPALFTVTAGAVLAAIPSFVIWSFSGLENSLYALAVVALAATLIRAALGDHLLGNGVAVACGLLAALAALTRPDGLIHVAAYPIVLAILVTRATLLPSVRQAAISGIAFAVPFGAFLAWRYVLFGRLLPNTALAKEQNLPEFRDLGRVSDLITYAGWLAVLIAVACLAVQCARPSRTRTALVVGTVQLVLALVAYCVLSGDWMPQYRFATPVWALGALIGTLAVWTTFGAARGRGRVALTLALACAILLSGLRFSEQAKDFRAGPTVPLCVVADRYGRTFNGYADLLDVRQGSLLLPDLGGTALTSRLTLHDMVGLTSAVFARFHAADDMAGLRDHVFTELRPDFIHTHGAWSRITGLPDDERMRRDYHLVTGVAEPGASQNWVRKDLVSGPAELAALRAYHDAVADAYVDDAPLRSCGAALRRGQTLIPADGD